MKTLVLILTLIATPVCFAKGKGGFSIGVVLGLTSTGDQTDIITLISDANTRVGGISTSKMSSGLEYSGFWSYRFSGSMVALQLRPSYFSFSETGSDGASNPYNYEVSGFTIFPVLRFNVLESKIFKFFVNAGVGWGFVNGTVTEAAVKVEYSGNAMGSLAGLGAEFCFAGTSHCMTVEGNLRYLPIERTTVDAVTGAPAAIHTGTALNGEYEINNSDVGVSLSGIMGSVGYTYYF